MTKEKIFPERTIVAKLNAIDPGSSQWIIRNYEARRVAAATPPPPEPFHLTDLLRRSFWRAVFMSPPENKSGHASDHRPYNQYRGPAMQVYRDIATDVA